MCDFDVPFLFNYISIPTAIFSLIIGFFIIFSNSKEPANRNLFYFISAFIFWILDQFLAWQIHEPGLNLIIERIGTLVVLSTYFFLIFVFSLINTKPVEIKKRLLYFIPFLPIIFLLNTDYNIYSIDYNNCEVQNGSIYWYVYLLSFSYIFWSTLKLYKSEKLNEKIKKQIKIIIRSIYFFISWFVILSVLRYLMVYLKYNYDFSDNIFLLMPIGMVIFISLLTYAITKYQFLNIKLIAAQALTVIIWILIGSQLFFIKTPINFVLTGFTLVLSIVFGIMLVKSVKIEVKRKEELQMMSDKLSQANDQLRKLDNAKSEFISIASHQLRTPLTSIKGYTSLIMEGTYGKILPKVHDALNKIYLSNERLIDLVENLLSISRIESGRMEYKFQECQIEDTLKELMDTFALTARSRKMSLELKLPEAPLPKINMDSGKIREVISNLMDNALKYTKRGGVSVRAELTTNNMQQTTNDNRVIRITIADTGIGIPKEELPYLFSKFSRGKDTSRLHVGGTGLGLYVGKSMVEAHHGKIWAESDGQDKGSRFIVELPVMQASN
jgi:signal transduction histidine kinase